MKLVYLHGVGNGDPEGAWLAGLNQGLSTIDSSPISTTDVVSPRYSALLGAQHLSVKHPPITYREKNDRAASRAFHQRQAQLERRIRQFDNVRTFSLGKVPTGLVDRVQNASINYPKMDVLKQVQNYLTDVSVRAAVLQHILDQLPSNDDHILLVGHSLGSVIAIDLLDHLPDRMHVQRFITAGSPAGNSVLHRDSERILKRFPYSRVDDWSNFLDPLDAVTAGRGLATIFPGAQDFWIRGAADHSASSYLANPAVATVVADVFHPRTTVARSTGAVAPRLDKDDAAALLTLEYLNAMSDQIPAKGDTGERFEDVVAVLRRTYVDEVQERVGSLPPELVELTTGMSPNLPRRWDLQEAIAQVVVLSYSNLIAPYEIDTGDAAVDAIPAILQRLGYPSGIGRKVRSAVKELNDHLDDQPIFGTRTRIALAAAGVVLLAAGPVGIAVSGAAGVAGAAALTSGLAAFGPGGMVGGLAMLGGLASTGGVVAAAAATARPGAGAVFTDPTAIAIQVAIAQSLRDVGETYEDDLWYRLTFAETEIAARINRIAAFSDSKAPALKKLRAARETIIDLMKYARTHNLVPASIDVAFSDHRKQDGQSGESGQGSRVKLPWK